eukprot:3314055-Rhodomonas_salina.2
MLRRVEGRASSTNGWPGTVRRCVSTAHRMPFAGAGGPGVTRKEKVGATTISRECQPGRKACISPGSHHHA